MYFKYVIFFSRTVLKIFIISEELWKWSFILPSYLYDIPGEFLLLPFHRQAVYWDAKGQMGSQYLFTLEMRCKNSGCSCPLAMQHGWRGEAAAQLRFQEANQAVLVEKLQLLFPIFLLWKINFCLDVNPFEGSSCRELKKLSGIQGYVRCVKMKPTLKGLAN